MLDYYDDKLPASKLKQVYELAPPRTRQYLAAEIDFVLEHVGPKDTVLELGFSREQAQAALSTSEHSWALLLESLSLRQFPCNSPGYLSV